MVIRLAKQTTIQPETEYPVIVVTSRSSIMTIDRIQAYKPTNRVLSVQAFEEVQTHFPFRILLKNVLKKPVNLRKNMPIAVGTEPAEVIIAKESLNPSSETEMTASTIWIRMIDGGKWSDINKWP